MIDFSVVIPLYKCSETIKELCDRLQTVFITLEKTYEIILVNDGSPGNDWEVACGLSNNNKHIKSINLSRNFGQHPAIFCGLENAKGEWIVVMDGDLQDVPEEIEKLYNKALEGFEIVLARRAERKDKFIKKLGSFLFYKVLNYLTDKEFDNAIGNFGVYHKKVVLALLSMGDHMKFFYSMVSWVGFNSTAIDVIHASREVGKSSYSFYKLFTLAFDGIISFSNKPLKLVIRLGFIIVLTSFVIILYNIVKYLNGGIVVMGYVSTIVSIWFLSGCLISILGIIGIYLGSIFDKVKERPVYIIKEIKN